LKRPKVGFSVLGAPSPAGLTLDNGAIGGERVAEVSWVVFAIAARGVVPRRSWAVPPNGRPHRSRAPTTWQRQQRVPRRRARQQILRLRHIGRDRADAPAL